MVAPVEVSAFWGTQGERPKSIELGPEGSFYNESIFVIPMSYHVCQGP